MKYLFCLFLFCSSLSTFAGETDCTDLDVYNSSGNYTLQTMDCIKRIEKSESTYLFLPSNPATGTEFVYQDNGTETCDSYEYEEETYESCYTQGVGFQSVDATYGVTVGDSLTYWSATKGFQVRVRFDGSNWVVTDEGFYQ